MNHSVEIVIVLYKCPLEESISFASFLQLRENIKLDVELILFNNDSELLIEDERFIVVNSVENVKVAGAYNFALKRAMESGREWLLLLDQDTAVPENYFMKLQEFLAGGYRDDLAAVVPVMKSGSRILSPKKVSPFLRLETDIKDNGYNSRVTAINSMSLVKVDFVKSLGGFSNEYQLDMLDRWFYNRIMKGKRMVYVLDLSSNHSLSFLDFEKNVSPERYSAYIEVENRFAANEMNAFYYCFYKVKLILKSLRQFVKYKNKSYSKITFSYLFKK